MMNPIKILSVEDDEFMRIFLKDIFWLHCRSVGFGNCELEIVDNIKDAEEKIFNPETKPNLIILDVMLPQNKNGSIDREGGFKLLEKIKSDPKNKDIKVVIFSAYRDKELQSRALKMGAEKFLVKGEHLPHDLAKVIYEVLNQKSEA